MIVISALMALPAIYAVLQLRQLSFLTQRQVQRHAQARVALGKLNTAMAELERFARGYIIDGTDQQRAELERTLQSAQDQLAQLRNFNYRPKPPALVSAEEQLTSIAQSIRNVEYFMQNGRREEATAYFTKVRPLLDNEQMQLQQIGRAIENRSNADRAKAFEIAGTTNKTTIVGLMFCGALVLIIGYWTTYALTTPVRRLRRAMADVAAGQFVVPDDLPYRRQDEIGDLARSFSWMTEHLARLDKMKAEFISIATHELKTPINVIGGYAELVEEGLYGPVSIDQRNALDAIREQTQVLTRLVNQLLDISRLEAGGLHLHMGIVQVEGLLDSLQRSFTILAQQKAITLRFDIEDSVPPAIQGDSDRLRDQVLGNLLSNALKFTGENGRVGVRAWGTERALELEVTDSGVGIPKDKVAFIFDKFFQIGEHARSKGAGLGLAIAREVVEAHGGRIWVESEQDVGTTFRITLPVNQPKLRRVAEEPVEAGVAEGNG
jgi:signal transduction histidine kinase